MAVDLLQRHEEVRRLFQKGSEFVGRDLEELLRHGPEQDLARTDVSQVAIFLHSMGVLHALRERLGDSLRVSFTCGLSLGEYSALVCAGSLSVEQALEVVAHRGRYMQEAAQQNPGGMTSVIGLSLAQVRELVAAVRRESNRVLAVANVNSPRQVVVSGESAALSGFEERACNAGARRCVRLKVAGAFHSPLVAPAAERLSELLKRLTIRPPGVGFIPNRIGRPVSDPEVIRRCLLEQVTGSVLWAPSVEALVASGVTRALELGPGRVLAALVKQTAPSMEVTSLGTQKEVERWKGPS